MSQPVSCPHCHHTLTLSIAEPTHRPEPRSYPRPPQKSNKPWTGNPIKVLNYDDNCVKCGKDLPAESSAVWFKSGPHAGAWCIEHSPVPLPVGV